MIAAVLFEGVAVVIVVAVITGKPFWISEPFGCPDMGDYPVSLLIEIGSEQVDVKDLLNA